MSNGETENELWSVNLSAMWNPWKTHWALTLVKGIREPREVKKKKSFDLGGNPTHDLRIRSTVTLLTELRGRTEKVGDDLGGESRRRESKGTYECCAALCLCFTVCVHSATRHNIHSEDIDDFISRNCTARLSNLPNDSVKDGERYETVKLTEVDIKSFTEEYENAKYSKII